LDALHIVICDTNPAELERYTGLCRTICLRKQVTAAFATFSNSGELLFHMMDPSYSSMVNILVLEPFNGCEKVAESVRGFGYDGVILYHSRLADEQYFYQAFNAGAYNYVKKGSHDRFEVVFENALKAARDLERQYIALRFGEEYRQIDLRDIFYFETHMNHTICVWYIGGKFVFRANMSDLEGYLSKRSFVRVHHSFLVALGAIRKISSEQVTLFDGKVIPVSRRKYAAIKETLDKWSEI